MATKFFGARVKRREDPRLITGTAEYTDDISLTGMLYAAFVRSPHAHARIRSVDLEAARAAPGVVAVFSGKDLEDKVNPLPTAWLVPDSNLKTPPHPALALDTVRYVGDGVVVIVAEDRYQAEDATELVKVDYEILEPVVNSESAVQEGAPVVHEEAQDNVAFDWNLGGGDLDQAFADSDGVFKIRLLNQRLIPNAIEPRGCVAEYNSGSGKLTLRLTSQNPHIHRLLLSGVLNVPEHKLRIVAPEIGGGFGSKIAVYADEAVVAFCAMQTGKAVKWVETRRENYVSTTHGRDHITDLEAAYRQDGKILGLKVKTYANMGAYLSTAAPGVPTWLYGLMLSGVYDIPAIQCQVLGVLTHTTPTDAYRGAGRPEATYVLERVMDLLATELDLDIVEIRRRNFIQKEQFPHTVAMGISYDSGDYELTLGRCLEMLGYEAFRAEQAEARKEGRHLGLGLSTYAEMCGLGPSQVVGSTGFQGGLWESGLVRVHPTGKVHVFIGASPHGQGEETTFAQIVASEIGVDTNDVKVIHGDTDNTPMGWGTYGSRTTAVGGAALAMAVRKIRDKAKVLAAHLLEASVEDMDYDDGKFFVKGSPDKAKTIQDIALMANVAWNMPEGMEPGLEASTFYDPPNFVFPYGSHLAVVEVDTETGHVELTKYTALDDCGPQINPVIVEGQVHGGVVQGIGQALWEEAVYDESAQLITGSMLDYALPRADRLPPIEVISTVTPSPHHPLGVKGIGEAGTIASTVTVYNAVLDALRPLGVTSIDMPFTPERVWRAIQDAKGN